MVVPFQPRAAGQNVVRNVEHVVRLVIGEVTPQDVDPPIDLMGRASAHSGRGWQDERLAPGIVMW